MARSAMLALFGLLTAACAFGDGPGRSKDPKGVIRKSWYWEETITPAEKITAPDPERYALFLTETGKLQARFDCKRRGGDYKISIGQLSFGPLISTRAACPPDSLDGPFMRDLQAVRIFYIENGYLYLELPTDGRTLRFWQTP